MHRIKKIFADGFGEAYGIEKRNLVYVDDIQNQFCRNLILKEGRRIDEAIR